jgi:hypothetical protein
MKEVRVNVLRLIIGGKKFKYGDLIDIDKYPEYYGLFASYIDDRRVIPTKNFPMVESHPCMIPTSPQNTSVIPQDNSQVINELKSTMSPIHDTLKAILTQLQTQPKVPENNSLSTAQVENIINSMKPMVVTQQERISAAPIKITKPKDEPTMKEFIPDFNTNQIVSSNVNAKASQTKSNVMDAVSALKALKNNTKTEDISNEEI